jgi:hypothetical protein
MLALGILFYLGCYGVNPDARPRAFLAVWLGVCLLLGALVVLALLDVRLTLRLRRLPGTRT